MIKSRLLILLCFTLFACSADSEHTDFDIAEKIKGVTYTGPSRGPLPPEMISSITKINGNYIALVPEATLYRQNLKVTYNRSGGWFGESMEATLQGIELARENDLQVMIKPHIAVGHDRSGFTMDWPNSQDSTSRSEFRKKYRQYIDNQPDKLKSEERWRGAVMVKNNSDWDVLAKNYSDFIMEYAKLADSLNVEMFCIGTELKQMALEKPDYWKKLIKDVRSVYNGKLTYAANWDSYDSIQFWEGLDYIGIDAYFPLSGERSPSVSELKNSWQPYKKQIKAVATKYGKPVLFTEWGYENEYYAAETPWSADGRETENGRPENRHHISDQAQVDLYEATFQKFWDEPWFAGLFMWRWSPPGELNRGIPTYNYSPIGKPAEQTLRQWFGID